MCEYKIMSSLHAQIPIKQKLSKFSVILSQIVIEELKLMR